ncbi:MAG: hypothetical protein K2M98_03505, partial [Muribaculum sp.]|nr:hypothetical protein [Muribaculum sp.]
MKKLFLPLALLLLATACKPTVSPDGNFTLADFNEINLDSTNSQLLTDDVAIGTGVLVRIVNDSILAVKTIRSDNQVMLYNTLSGEVRPAVAKGSGPLEMIRVAGMSATPDGTLWIVGSGDNKVMTAAWNDSTVTTDERFTAQTAIVNGTPNARGGAIVLPVGDCNARIAVLGQQGEITATTGSFPQIEIPDSVMYNNFTFQADIAYSPDRNIAVVSNKSWPEIEIYGLADNASRHIFGPMVSDARMEEQPTPMGAMYIQKTMLFMFDGVVAGPESFFV